MTYVEHSILVDDSRLSRVPQASGLSLAYRSSRKPTQHRHTCAGTHVQTQAQPILLWARFFPMVIILFRGGSDYSRFFLFLVEPINRFFSGRRLSCNFIYLFIFTFCFTNSLNTFQIFLILR